MVIPYGAGSSPDVFARLVGDQLQQRLGQPIVVENRVGAGGNVGTGLVAKAPGDGYTFLVSTNGPLVYSTVFNEERLEALPRGRPPAELRRALLEHKITHVYVDWSEIERYRRALPDGAQLVQVEPYREVMAPRIQLYVTYVDVPEPSPSPALPDARAST